MVEQVGGTHYGDSNFKHWDWVLSLGLPYLEAHATKYLARWDKKGVPLQDLEKTLSFIDKIKENAPLCMVLIKATRPGDKWVRAETIRFLDTNNIKDRATQSAIMMLATWETTDTLNSAAVQVRRLIELVKRSVPIPEAKPVPAEDSNRHAERIPHDRTHQEE
jgi:hypothetical protein